MATFKESDLDFSFPDDWEVKKYDATRFYNYLSGVGFKGVDFIAITPEPKLILIEVKNYRNRWEADGINPTDVLKEDVPNFVATITKKFEDTFRLLQIIQKYYLRKWWYRNLALPILNKNPNSFLIKKEFGFWWLANLLLEQKKIDLILWLELSDEILEKEKWEIFKKISHPVQKELSDYSFQVFCAAKNDFKYEKGD